MELNNIEDCHINLYRSGLVVVTRSVCRNYDAEPEELKVKQVKKRKYTIAKNKVRSAAIALWQQKKSRNAIFFTVTIPFKMSEPVVAECWRRFLDNFNLRYPNTLNVWVKERQKSTGNIHYHIIVGRNRVGSSARNKKKGNEGDGFKELQRTWNKIIENVTGNKPKTSCSVRRGTKPVVYNIVSVARYLSKYISKGDGKDDKCTEFYGRAWGCSRELVLKRLIDPDELDRLGEKHGLILLVNEPFCRVYVVRNYIDYG